MTHTQEHLDQIPIANYQTKVRGTNEQEYQIYLIYSRKIF